MEDAEGCGYVACLYLRSDNINWLLQYAADELMFHGVGRNKEKEDEKTCNSEVAGMRLGRDSETNAWTATFVDGVHVGTTKRFASYDLTAAQRSKLLELNGTSTCPDSKTASKQLTTLWCQVIVDEKSGEFEKEWGLVFETPKKKPRR